MNKFLVLVFFVILLILGGLFYFLQQPQAPTAATENPLTLEYNAQQTTPGQQLQEAGKSDSHLQADVPTDSPAGPLNPKADMIEATKAIIKTSKGDITVELYPDDAPQTVSNFAKKAQSGFYTNLSFHRVEDWVVQGGDPKGDGTGGGNMPTEFNDRPYVAGSLGVARRNDPKVQNDAQFFFTKTDADWLNGQYTNFGTVTDGMDVVNSMEIGDKILSITVE